jgi:hypothetical protein
MSGFLTLIATSRARSMIMVANAANRSCESIGLDRLIPEPRWMPKSSGVTGIKASHLIKQPTVD